jgi:hypothetical protein
MSYSACLTLAHIRRNIIARSAGNTLATDAKQHPRNIVAHE